MKIAMLLSGGVDSSVGLARLVAAGHDVTAFYMKIWLEDEMSYLGSCPWEEDLRYARAVAEQLGVPLEVVPFQKEYHERVVSYTIEAVRAGLTPNPDVMCNSQVKFGAFLEKFGGEFDAAATGHYAQIVKDGEQIAHLLQAPDPVKDQTYFLSMLTQAQIAKAMFPIGDLQKSEVRKLAHEFGLPTAERKDSQGICFLGKISFKEFLLHHLGSKSGDVIEQSTGKVVGHHDGAYLYTIGQRKGLELNGGPWYVCAKDIAQNVVYVAHGFAAEPVVRDTFTVGGLNWIASAPTTKNLKVKLRHGPEFYDCQIQFAQNSTDCDSDKLNVKLSTPDRSVTPGQYAVFYNGGECLGGGVVLE